jgi:hypothetical protein
MVAHDRILHRNNLYYPKSDLISTIHTQPFQEYFDRVDSDSSYSTKSLTKDIEPAAAKMGSSHHRSLALLRARSTRSKSPDEPTPFFYSSARTRGFSQDVSFNDSSCRSQHTEGELSTNEASNSNHQKTRSRSPHKHLLLVRAIPRYNDWGLIGGHVS